jgi:hypothetical protein
VGLRAGFVQVAKRTVPLRYLLCRPEPAVLPFLALTALADPAEPLPDVLPAAVMVTPNSFHGADYRDCADCPSASAVVIAGPFATLSEAQRAAERFTGLTPGYPLLAHTDQLGLADDARGFVAVAGFLASLDEAARWQAARLPGRADAVALAMGGEHYARLDVLYSDRTVTPIPHKAVVTIDQPGGTDAWAAAPLRARWGRGEPPVDGPICRIESGASFVVESVESLLFYDWAPATCDGVAVYVPWRSTSLAATVQPHPDGGHEKIQAVGAECDSPSFAGWRYGPDGQGEVLFDDGELSGHAH